MTFSVMQCDGKALEQASVYVHSATLSCCRVQSVQADHSPFCFQGCCANVWHLMCMPERMVIQANICFRDCGANAWQCILRAGMHGNPGKHCLLRWVIETMLTLGFCMHANRHTICFFCFQELLGPTSSHILIHLLLKMHRNLFVDVGLPSGHTDCGDK